MQLTIELGGQLSPDWFDRLTDRVTESGLGNVSLTEVKAAPGTFGGSRSPKMTVTLSNIADLATILTFLGALYAAASQPAPVTPPTPPTGTPITQAVEAHFKSSDAEFDLVIPCQNQASPEVIKSVTDAMTSFSGKAPMIRVSPHRAQ